MENFERFFQAAFGGRDGSELLTPFSYQRRLALEPWPDLLNVPTGLGKTAAVVLAWLWKRGWRTGGNRVGPDDGTPRRLVLCLPMRVLVGQTETVVRDWLKQLGQDGTPGQGRVSVHVLMGGSDDVARATWAEHPEEDMVLIGTQDMLLSRALMRGYGMSRYQWPVHFAWLHNDCLWVFDEVQVMGAGLCTSLQLDAFRRALPRGRDSRSLWMSATLNPRWLDTVDMRPHLPTLTTLALDDDDRRQAVQRLQAIKKLERAAVVLTRAADNKAGKDAYIKSLAAHVLQVHDPLAQTLVIVNRVDRAQALFTQLRAARPGRTDLLIHARFRPVERSHKAFRLTDEPSADRIVVATQAIEAGVDISSKVLVTELAPWASMVQRFGRCNRYGEHNQTGAWILWVDIEEDADAKPYTAEALTPARDRLQSLSGASPDQLPPPEESRPLSAVLRRKDLFDLFNTDPDLSGFDVDVSDFIRDSDTPDVQVFWRSFGDDPNMPEPQALPARDELCPVSIAQARAYAGRPDVELWQWDALARSWARLAAGRTPRPGMSLMARAADGGYDTELGFMPESKRPPVPMVPAPAEARDQESFADDWRSRQALPVALSDHLEHVASHAAQICLAVGESTHRVPVIRAGRWHDVGKVHPVFDRTMHACNEAPQGFLAKSPCKARHARPYFRHELASMLAWLAQHDGEPDADLIAYLVAAHHGKVRMSLRAMPGEEAPPGTRRFARGVHEGDALPQLNFDGERSEALTLKLALMEMGLGEQGPSWAERSQLLLDAHGPFRLTWLEALVRVADWRASRDEQINLSGFGRSST